MNRMDVMVYSLMAAAFSALAAGFCLDVGFKNTGLSFGLIGGIALSVALLAYLERPKPNDYDTRSGVQGG